MGLEYAKRSLDITTTSISSLDIYQSSHPVMSPLTPSAVLNPEDIEYVDLKTNIASGLWKDRCVQAKTYFSEANSSWKRIGRKRDDILIWVGFLSSLFYSNQSSSE